MSGREYTCEACRGVFEQGWSDEERDAEALAIFGELAEEDKAIVCDDCFKRMMGDMHGVFIRSIPVIGS
jgi:hypothetical protein